MNKRITRYGVGPGGGRMLRLQVRGIVVAVEPRDADEQAAAEKLAEEIAALGPADGEPQEQPVSRPLPPAPIPAIVIPFAVGERVYCIVHGAEGWSTVTEVGAGRNHGRIKISGMRLWCPAHNFKRSEK